MPAFDILPALKDGDSLQEFMKVEGATYQEMMQAFGVGNAQVWRILSRQQRKHR